MPQINALGLAIVKRYEGCELAAYPDPGTGGEPWTIGYGHTGLVNGRPVSPGLTITPATADDLLRADLAHFEAGVNAMLAHSLNSNQFSALVSFAYNVGLGALQRSHLLFYINVVPRDWSPHEILSLFTAWVYADGQVLPGLLHRRIAEANLFNLAEPAA